MVEHDHDQVGAEHRDVAVGEVDDPHQPEHQREPAGEQRVVAAEEDSLETALTQIIPRPCVRDRRPKYASVICSRVSSPPGPRARAALRACRRPASATDSRTLQVLLDEHDRRPLADQGLQRLVDRLDGDRARGRARPRRAAAAADSPSAHGRSPSPAARRRTGSRRAAGAAASASGRPRARSRRSSGPARAAPPTSRFSSTVRSGKSRRPSGTSAIPIRSRSWAADARDVGAVEEDAPGRSAGARRRSSAGASSCRRRWRRRARRSRPRRARERDPAHRRQQPVPRLDLVELQQRVHATTPPR